LAIEPEKIFRKGIELHHYANTAYPLDGSKVWRDYKVREDNDKIDSLVSAEWAKVEELGLYIHIPFCKKRCLYCEYTVLTGDESSLHEEYVELLLKEVDKYNQALGPKQIVGFDIGGGTPTTLSPSQIERIIQAVTKNHTLANKFDISIETTPLIAAEEKEKIAALRKLGIDRISMGVQTIDTHLLATVGRGDNTIKILETAVGNIRDSGFERFNIDLMYGFAGQSTESFKSTLEFAMKLNPEYITLYRNRYKGTKLEKDAARVTLEDSNVLYSLAFQTLLANGYEANMGKNTFSKVKGDFGTSAYLTKRVVEGTPYLGMGLGAQNMSLSSIYYNQGAA
jgi:coproporphyrinogen III oxidase-like Fe-S oxidoreductase